jgi:hypothetical protein
VCKKRRKGQEREKCEEGKERGPFYIQRGKALHRIRKIEEKKEVI